MSSDVFTEQQAQSILAKTSGGGSGSLNVTIKPGTVTFIEVPIPTPTPPSYPTRQGVMVRARDTNVGNILINAVLTLTPGESVFIPVLNLNQLVFAGTSGDKAEVLVE